MLQENKDLGLDRTRLQSVEQDHVFTSPFNERDEDLEPRSNTDRFNHGLHLFLPIGIRGPIQAIRSAYQYITVTTERGSYEHRMPLRDAVNLLSVDEGLKIHCSFWVAKSQIKGLVYEFGNPRMVDCTGRRLPVSRPMVPAIKTVLNT